MRLFLLLNLIIFSVTAIAQPSNDVCNTATELTNISNFCSDYGAYNNFGAKPSIPNSNICIPNDATAKDVWFKFVAIANYVNLVVNGKSPNNPGGTLISPQLLLYSGTCNALLEIDCISDAFQNNNVEIFAGPLTPGQTYYINVSARNDNVGTFQLCINNYNQNFVPDGDCPTSRKLCDKSTVFIDAVFDPGKITNEIPNFTCIGYEKASSWFRWTCSKSGTLTLKLSPTKLDDDLDFAVFELTGGIDDCASKRMIRCCASGENVGEPYELWKQCTGPTGMNLTSTDEQEQPGCGNGNDSYVKYIDMEEGKSYALFVNNFSKSGKGYTMEFGGTGEFLGARANFDVIPDGTCFEDSLTFINKSIAPTDPIVDYKWNFGNAANPNSYNDANPPKVKYASPGYKSVSLTITSKDGCVDTYVKNFVAQCCVDPLSVDLTVNPSDVVLLGDKITLNGIVTNAVGSVKYEWIPANLIQECFTCPSVSLIPVKDDIFHVLVEDNKGCIAEDSIEIRIVDITDVVAPNIFSPNYDGINDYFNIFPNRGAKTIKKLLVFNRWGACVYEGSNLRPGNDGEGWDGTFKGKECNPDVYVYYSEVEFLNGRIQIVKGSITLVR